MTNLKIWWVLRWDQYYPSGGLGNVYSRHYTEEEDIAQCMETRPLAVLDHHTVREGDM